jgi:transcriptional regulator with XRE-family HTH domain
MMDVDLRQLGVLLRRARESHGTNGMQPGELAIVTGISEAALASYERGDRQVTVRNLWRIAAVLGLDLNELRRATLVHRGADEEPLEDPDDEAGVVGSAPPAEPAC